MGIRDLRSRKSVFTLSDFYRMPADADVSDLVALFFGAGIYVTGALHLDALLNVQGLSRLLQSSALASLASLLRRTIAVPNVG